MTTEEAKEGVIRSFYSQGMFVKVKQYFAIDKVCFSFVKKGSHGKGGIDIYVKIDDFDNFCDDILSGKFMQSLQHDNPDNPSAWKCVSGDNGHKEISIGKGRMQPIVFHGWDKKAKKNLYVGIVSYDELISMAKWFRRISKQYFETRAQICANAVMYKPKEVNKNKRQTITLMTMGPAEPLNNGNLYRIPAMHMNNKMTNIYLNKASMEYLGDQLYYFLNDIAYNQRELTMNAEVNNDNYLLIDNLYVR